MTQYNWKASNNAVGIVAQPIETYLPGAVTIGNSAPNHNVTFHNEAKQLVGTLDFNGPRLKFNGHADESAEIFVEAVGRNFMSRLRQEREAVINQVAALEFATDEQRDTASIIVQYLRSLSEPR